MKATFFKILGIIIIIAGIALGAYVGIWLLLAQGLIQLINACKNNFETMGVVIGLLRVLFCWVGIIIARVSFVIGALLAI